MNRFVYLITAVIILGGCSRSSQVKQPAYAGFPVMYIGTYTQKESHVDGKAEGIYIYAFDTTNGSLHYVATCDSTVNPSFLTVDAENKVLYAVNETGNGTISAFKIENNGRSLLFINKVSSKGDYPCYVTTDPAGEFVMAANYGTGNIAFFPINGDSIMDAVYVHQHTGKGTTTRQDAAHAHCILPTPDNRFAYATDLGTDEIYCYKIKSGNCFFDTIGSPYKTTPGAGPRHLVIHPFLPVIYCINELNGTIEIIHMDKETGKLRKAGMIATVAERSQQMQAACADIHLTPDGRFLFASNRGNINSISFFGVDSVNGSLTYTGEQVLEGRTPRNFAIDPSGRFLLVANQDSDQIMTFKINTTTGKLEGPGTISSVPTPVCIKFSTK